MIKWLIGTWNRVFGGKQAHVYRPSVDVTAPIIMYGFQGR
jgi:hypothetical protein